MIDFRQLCCQFSGLLLLGLLFATPLFAAGQMAAPEPTVQQLQQENAGLQRKVLRLESQVAALRDELTSPGATQIVGGIGYIVGLFGVAGWLTARKKTGQEK